MMAGNFCDTATATAFDHIYMLAAQWPTVHLSGSVKFNRPMQLLTDCGRPLGGPHACC